MEKIVEGVYIQTIENKKVVQKYVPLSNVYLVGKEITLGEHLETVNAQIEALNKRIDSLENKLSQLENNENRLESVFENTIRGFVTK